MNAVYISPNHLISLPCYKPRQFFSSARESTLSGRTPLIQIRGRSIVSACLNVDVAAHNTSKSKLEKTKDVIEMEGKFLVGTYARTPVVLERGEGCKLYDVEGREYLDLSSGIAVNALGHGDVDWLKAVVEQAATLTHTSNIFYTIPQVRACYYVYELYQFLHLYKSHGKLYVYQSISLVWACDELSICIRVIFLSSSIC